MGFVNIFFIKIGRYQEILDCRGGHSHLLLYIPFLGLPSRMLYIPVTFMLQRALPDSPTILTSVTIYSLPRSTLHHGSFSSSVRIQDPCSKLDDISPSTANDASRRTASPVFLDLIDLTLDCCAAFLKAISVSVRKLYEKGRKVRSTSKTLISKVKRDLSWVFSF